MKLNQEFWEERYQTQQMGWDIGQVSTPIKEYIDQLDNKDLKILIPGCGNAYEAEYLWKNGFKNVYLLDLAPSAFDNLKKRIPDFPEEQMIVGDFFQHEGQYDLIIEQTFFCAINPELRPKYAEKMQNLLKPNGKLIGLLFNIPLHEDHPPFGGNKSEYLQYFEPHFQVETFDTAYNSIEPRKGNELFIILGNDKPAPSV